MVTDTVLKYPSKDPTALFGVKYVAAWRVIFHVIVVKKTSKLKELTIYISILNNNIHPVGWAARACHILD